MDRLPYATPPRWWSPLLRPRIVRLMRPYFIRRFRVQDHLVGVEVRGLENLQEPLDKGHGVMITSKHVGHVDPFVMLAAADMLGRPVYFMAGWQVFQLLKPLARLVIRFHGCFSVDREGTDLRAFRKAVEILQNDKHPLVMFPEGEIYHHCEWVAPFRIGTATIALSAAKRGNRPISCIPTAIKYEYVEDPIPRLNQLMDSLEERILWRPRRSMPLAERIFAFAEALISLKELDYLGQNQPGKLPERIDALAETVLQAIEERQGAQPTGSNIPERITPLRQHAIKRRESLPANDPGVREADRDLDDLFFVTQLYSYTYDYYSTHWSLERMAEILDKLEEDVLGLPPATIRGDRRAIISFGKAIEVKAQKRNKDEARILTKTLERAVQAEVNQLFGHPKPLSSEMPAPDNESAP